MPQPTSYHCVVNDKKFEYKVTVVGSVWAAEVFDEMGHLIAKPSITVSGMQPFVVESDVKHWVEGCIRDRVSVP
jgi:hypothetical protein